MYESNEGFKDMQNLCHKISASKINEGIFVGSDMKNLISNSNFLSKLDKLK